MLFNDIEVIEAVAQRFSIKKCPKKIGNIFAKKLHHRFLTEFLIHFCWPSVLLRIIKLRLYLNIFLAVRSLRDPPCRPYIQLETSVSKCSALPNRNIVLPIIFFQCTIYSTPPRDWYTATESFIILLCGNLCKLLLLSLRHYQQRKKCRVIQERELENALFSLTLFFRNPRENCFCLEAKFP